MRWMPAAPSVELPTPTDGCRRQGAGTGAFQPRDSDVVDGVSEHHTPRTELRSSSIFTRGLVIVLILETTGVGLRYISQVILARLAGSHDYGQFTFAYSWGQLLSIPAGLGFSAAVIRFVPAYRAHRDWPHLRGIIRRSTQITSVTGAIIAAVGICTVKVFDLGGESQNALIISLASIPIFALSMLQAETLRGAGRLFSARVVPNVLQPALVIGVAGAVALVSGHLDSAWILLSFAISYVVGLVFQQAALRRSQAPDDIRTRRSYETRSWFSVAMPLLRVKGYQLALNQSDIILVGAIAGVTASGVYSAASKTATLAQLIFSAVTLAVSPSISAAWAKGDKRSVERTVRASAQLSFFPTLVLTLGLILFGGSILRLFGAPFSAAYVSLVVLSLGRLGNALTGPVGMILGVTGHQRINARVYGLAAVEQLVLDLLLIPKYGVLGASIASTVTMLSWNALLFISVTRLLGIRLWPLPARESHRG